MASVSDNCNFDAMEEDLSCSICLNLLREPKDLDCPHVYCLQCLQNWVGKETTIICPECRHNTVVPAGGLAKLKTNLRLKNMAEKYAARLDKQKNLPLCQIHEGERQHFFCVTCNETVCRDCLVLQHARPHEIKELTDITRTRKTEIKMKLNRVHEKIKNVEDDEKKLAETERKVQAAMGQAEDEVDRRTESMIADLEAKRKIAKELIQTIGQQHLKILQGEKNRTKDQAKRLRNLHSATQDIVHIAADYVYLDQHTTLVDKIKKLCIEQREIATSEIACLHFYPGLNPVNPAWFGKVITNEHRKRKLTFLTEFGKFKRVQGITTTRTGFLVVVDYDSKEVIWYRHCNGKYERQFSLGSSNGKLIKPVHISSTSENKLIVIDINGPAKILTQTGKYEKSLSICGDRISTSSNDMVVVADRIKGVITVHQPNGELLRTHHLHTGNINDIATNGKQIAFTKPSEDAFVVIDRESGRELWTSNMTFPLGICFDDKSDSILVAGNSKVQGKFVIEQYCSTSGQKVARLATNLCNPLAMTIAHNGKLVVADWKTVKVYSIE